MNFTAQGLYEKFIEAHEETPRPVPWAELPQEQREVWALFAMRLRDSFRGGAKR